MVSLGQDSGGNRQHVGDGGDGDAEEQPDVLRVMTVHASKGLEFPIVYLPGLIQRNFPMQRHSNPVPPPDGMLPGESAGKTAHEIGEACLFYVGVTRSRDHLVLSYSQFNGKQRAKPSHYLETLLAGLPPERVTRLQWQGLAESSAPVEDKEETVVMSSARPSQHFIEKMKPDKLIAATLRTINVAHAATCIARSMVFAANKEPISSSGKQCKKRSNRYSKRESKKNQREQCHRLNGPPWQKPTTSTLSTGKLWAVSSNPLPPSMNDTVMKSQS